MSHNAQYSPPQQPSSLGYGFVNQSDEAEESGLTSGYTDNDDGFHHRPVRHSGTFENFDIEDCATVVGDNDDIEKDDIDCTGSLLGAQSRFGRLGGLRRFDASYYDFIDWNKLESKSRRYCGNQDGLKDVGYTCLQILIRIFWFFVPSFLHRSKDKPSGPLRSTAWLDGLRGIACVLVMCGHWIERYHSYLTGDFFTREHSFFQLPYIRLITGGYPMIGLFFGISGYALSFRALSLAHKGQVDKAHAAIASGVFRRSIRLRLPALVATFFTLMLRYNGYYDEFLKCVSVGYCGGHPQHLAPQMPTFGAQLSNWYAEAWRVIVFRYFVFAHDSLDTVQYYDQNLWTIPVEFTNSMIVFLAVLGLAACRKWIRVVMLMVITWHTYYEKFHSITPFIFGVFLAEVDLIRDQRQQKKKEQEEQEEVAAVAATEEQNVEGGEYRNENGAEVESEGNLTPRSRESMEKIQNKSLDSLVGFIFRDSWFQFILFLGGLFLLGQPKTSPETAFVFGTLWTWFPDAGQGYWEKQRIVPNIGVMLAMWAISNSPRLKTIFTNKPIQYLGKISFMIYVLHGEWGLRVVNTWFNLRAWQLFGTLENPRPQWALVLAFFCTVAVIIWTADIFWRAVDEPSVKFARWLEEKCKNRSFENNSKKEKEPGMATFIGQDSQECQQRR